MAGTKVAATTKTTAKSKTVKAGSTRAKLGKPKKDKAAETAVASNAVKTDTPKAGRPKGSKGKAAKPVKVADSPKPTKPPKTVADPSKSAGPLNRPALRALAAEVDVISGAGMRLEILALLATGEKSVSEITAAIEASQPGVSHHLTLLKTGGYVTNRRDGKFVFYTLDKAKCVDRLTKLAGVLGLSGGTLAGG